MFDELRALADDPERVFARVAQSLVEAREFHRLFDLRLIETRRRLGLPLDRRTPIDDVEEPLRSELESGYLAACREVGELLLESGRLREAWMYLRPAGDKSSMRQHLARAVADDQQSEELIELALFEGVDPERGYAWLLGRSGTCSAITTLDGMSSQLSADDLRACAAVLIRHIYGELRGNMRGHLQRLTGQAPPNISIHELLEKHPELVAGGNYHLDASHLASSMRYARLLTDPALVGKAAELAEYGQRLPADMQYPGEAPFEELYRTHRLFLDATLGRNVEMALEYFGGRARESKEDPESTTAVEVYLVLLNRAGRSADALAEFASLVSPGRELSTHAPTLLGLAAASGDWAAYDRICQERGDALGFAAGLAARLNG